MLSAIRGAQMASFLDVEQVVPPMSIEVTSDDDGHPGGDVPHRSRAVEHGVGDACIAYPCADRQRQNRVGKPPEGQYDYH